MHNGDVEEKHSLIYFIFFKKGIYFSDLFKQCLRETLFTAISAASIWGQCPYNFTNRAIYLLKLLKLSWIKWRASLNGSLLQTWSQTLATQTNENALIRNILL